MIQPKEGPILFSGQMVRAIVSGRKTQTRRVVKFPKNFFDGQPFCLSSTFDDSLLFGDSQDMQECVAKCEVKNPYKPGELLWVRENFFFDNPDYVKQYKENPWMGAPDRNNADVRYQAAEKHPDMFRWKPSIHMPRWASRLTLEITNVRVERLQDISEDDAKAEGITEARNKSGSAGWGDLSSVPFQQHPGDLYSCKNSFMHLWDSINGGESWDKNPWVWVVEFKKI